MARISLTIDPSYCGSWGFFEGCREILQNAKDADEYDDAKMIVEHLPRSNRLIISNEGVTLSHATLLLLGCSTKRGTDQRGQFGEGHVLGVLALIRAGHPVTIYNGDEVWRPAIEAPDAGHPFEGSNLLIFTTRKLREPRTTFSVEIENVSKDVWDITKKLFLFLSPPKERDVVKISTGRVLLHPDFKGQIFSRGIFVSTVDNVEFGYDSNNIKLDRDRNVIEEWDLRWRLAELLSAAHKQEPSKFGKRIYNMARDSKADVKSLAYHADANLLKALKDEFHEEFGATAVPVQHMEESKELETLGATSVVVSATLRELLEKSGLKASDIKKKLKANVKKRYGWSDLTPEEQRICTTWIERFTYTYCIVDFTDPSILCQVLTEDDGQTIGVNRLALSTTTRALVSALIVQQSIRQGVPEREVCLNILFEKHDGSQQHVLSAAT